MEKRKKTGAFLKQLRKEKNMTQEQLGERIGVTNKTVSRWETGNYMPPVECLELLSNIYQISINEILAGERLADEKIKEIADENIASVLGELQKENQKFENRMLVVLAITTFLTIAILFMLPLNNVKNIAVFVMVIAMGFISNTLNIVAVAAKKESNG
ncbi:MAG: helix-turn-helix domain-containing protein [Lachnospiraceae bacterium]|nr:helix-turn-helix domain-containing protein [Lachnospiraceae bacterium]